MNDEPGSSGETGPNGELAPENPPPELNATVEADLSASQVDDLFRDLALCASIQHISVKSAANVRPSDRSSLLDDLDLVKARHLLDLETTRAVQLRYEFDDAFWVDTVSRRDAENFHILRIQHAAEGGDE